MYYSLTRIYACFEENFVHNGLGHLWLKRSSHMVLWRTNHWMEVMGSRSMDKHSRCTMKTKITLKSLWISTDHKKSTPKITNSSKLLKRKEDLHSPCPIKRHSPQNSPLLTENQTHPPRKVLDLSALRGRKSPKYNQDPIASSDLRRKEEEDIFVNLSDLDSVKGIEGRGKTGGTSLVPIFQRITALNLKDIQIDCLPPSYLLHYFNERINEIENKGINTSSKDVASDAISKITIMPNSKKSVRRWRLKCSNEISIPHLLTSQGNGSDQLSIAINDLVVINVATNLIGISPPIRSLISINNKCTLLDWGGTREVVAESRWSSNDPKVTVDHVPLGPHAVKVWVDLPKKSNAFLWRPNSLMTYIKDVVGSTVAWPPDKVDKRTIVQISRMSLPRHNKLKAIFKDHFLLFEFLCMRHEQ
uniref:Transposase Tnp1/En/Spm-like domain-containing protein n=1 Tax=Cucumis melo TaxID=3656 RepID=A0A9I9EEN0_CUCME